MSVELLERVAAGGRVDRAACIIRGVKVIGLKSRNPRDYTEAALRGAVSMYEGVSVFVDHDYTPGDRQARDRFGTLRNARFDRDGIYADLHYNPKHLLAESVVWAADHAPEQYGLSHRAYGHGRQVGDRYLVEEIVCVRSVDLVAEPATTSGLFESFVWQANGNQALCQRIDACRQRMATLCNGSPRTVDAFARRLVESNSPAFPGEEMPDPAVSQFLAAADRVLRRDDLNISEKIAMIEKLLTLAEESQANGESVDQAIADITGQPTTESYRPQPGDLPADVNQFVEHLTGGPVSVDEFVERITQ